MRIFVLRCFKKSVIKMPDDFGIFHIKNIFLYRYLSFLNNFILLQGKYLVKYALSIIFFYIRKHIYIVEYISLFCVILF